MKREINMNWIIVGIGKLMWQALEKIRHFLSALSFNLYYSQTCAIHGKLLKIRSKQILSYFT